jgi:hypothetical protein
MERAQASVQCVGLVGYLVDVGGRQSGQVVQGGDHASTTRAPAWDGLGGDVQLDGQVATSTPPVWRARHTMSCWRSSANTSLFPPEWMSVYLCLA